MFRLARLGAPHAAKVGLSVGLGLALAPPSLSDGEAYAQANADVLQLSQHKSLSDLRAAGVKRREETSCSFCKWMTNGPCGDIYGLWDDCVHETKAADKGKDFVDMCRPFTIDLMRCIEKHPDYYAVFRRHPDLLREKW